MKLRIAKKKKYLDYKEEGFFLSCHFHPEHKDTDAEVDGFIDFIESKNLLCTVSFFSVGWQGMIIGAAKYYRTTEEDKQDVRDYVIKLPACLKVGTTPNIDINHGSEKSYASLEDEALPHWIWATPKELLESQKEESCTKTKIQIA